MTIILHVVICIRFICIETYVPTPLNFGCNDPSIHEAYLTREYPRWKYKAYSCDMDGRFV
jgi:hypothetical protein